jgi:RNA polymerase sigma factor (sigma-70 family)
MAAVPSIGRASAATVEAEAEAARALYERYSRQVFGFCLQRLGNREEAEDATQTTFLNAFRGLKRGVAPEFEAAWLLKIAHNVCLTRRRSAFRRRRVEMPGDLESLQLATQPAEIDELIRLPEALRGMPGRQRQALFLREWQGLSYKEIAGELGLSQPAVETLLFRARRSLAQGLTAERTRGLRGPLRDLGSLTALAKSLFFGGTAKVAVTVATVAATSAVVAAPPVRHELAHVVRGPVRSTAPPAVRHEAPKPRPKPVAPRRAAVERPPAPAVPPPVRRHRPPAATPAPKRVRVVVVAPRETKAQTLRPSSVAPVHAPVADAPAPPVPQPDPVGEPAAAVEQPVDPPRAPVVDVKPAHEKKAKPSQEAAPPPPATPIPNEHGNSAARHEETAQVPPATSPRAPEAAVPVPGGKQAEPPGQAKEAEETAPPDAIAPGGSTIPEQAPADDKVKGPKK